MAKVGTSSEWLERSFFSELHDGLRGVWGRIATALHASRAEIVRGLPVEIMDEEGYYVLKARIPAAMKRDISVDCSSGVLSIRGVSAARRNEIFGRTLVLPGDADTEQVYVSLHAGALFVEIQKKPRVTFAA